MSLWIWAALLVLQNATFTWVSRARNSGSDGYHALAAVFSNAIWFSATFGTIGIVQGAESWMAKAGLLVIYTSTTVAGSVGAGAFLRRYIERGSRRVGHYGQKEGK